MHGLAARRTEAELDVRGAAARDREVRHTVITFEVTGPASLHKAATMSSTNANTDVNLLAGARYDMKPLALAARLGRA